MVTQMEMVEMEVSVRAGVEAIQETSDTREWVEHGCRITTRTPKSRAAMAAILMPALMEICPQYLIKRSTWVLAEVAAAAAAAEGVAIFLGCPATTAVVEVEVEAQEETEEA